MYLFAISAIRCTIHRTYSKGDKQPVHAPWGPKEYIYVGICNFSSPMILERELTTFQSCSRLVHGIRTVPHNKIWFTATWSVQRLPFLRSDEWAWKVCIHRMCWSSKLQFWFVQRASSHQEISTSESYLHKAVGKMQDSHWYFEPSRQGFRKMLGSEMETSFKRFASVSEYILG